MPDLRYSTYSDLMRLVSLGLSGAISSLPPENIQGDDLDIWLRLKPFFEEDFSEHDLYRLNSEQSLGLYETLIYLDQALRLKVIITKSSKSPAALAGLKAKLDEDILNINGFCEQLPH